LRRQLKEEEEVGVRWLPACEDMTLGAEERPLLSQFRVAVVRSKKLVAEAGDSSGTQRKRNIRC
jgi:hypothetical protein